jgi:hypothetical protein
MPEPDHVVIESVELTAELNAILSRFGAEAVVRVVRRMVEEGETSPPRDAEHVRPVGQP